ncbi:exodeoxyribonuclease V subunit gamma [Seleniivibrio woodruffii]|uniref:exodeoxyribonuclease V subunit gamma n=1 Tax=Seleniivibrio woodruffii TaxID=1078050 RepID=UPI0039E27DB8
MLNIFIGNKLENLLKEMQKRLYNPSRPLKKPVVCVQTSGMQRWIGLALARETGICANLDYLFPAALIKRLAERHFGSEKLWADKQELTWRVYQTLLYAKDDGRNSELIEYIDNDPLRIKLFRLSQKIADIFDQYQVYRPEMTLDWLNKGFSKPTKSIEGWQPWLFNEVFPDRRRCKTHVLDRFYSDCKAGKVDFSGTDTLHIFGISVIPRFFMNILLEAGNHTDVNFYLLCPTMQYWGDSMSDWEKRRYEKRTKMSAEELLILENHRLLDNLGTMGRDFFEYLTENASASINSDNFEEPHPESMLGGIQAEIYDFTQTTDAQADDSISINSCHNPLREVEVLYDFILDTINRDGSITPADILVMTPDIRKYAPYIRSVFDNPYSTETAVPYTIADIPQKMQSGNAKVFTEIILAVTDEFSLSAAAKLIESPVVAEKFGLTSVQYLLDILERNGAYWGLDSETLRAEGITADTPFTWDRAMRRLALGLAEGGRHTIYSEAAGADVPFSMAEQIGGLMSFAEQCAKYAKLLTGEKKPDEWCSVLAEMADRFLSDDPKYADDAVELSKAIADIREETAQCRIKMPFRPVFESLNGILEEVKTAKGFITGKTTFCAMMPMRSIPFKVICVLGLDDGSFPREKTSPEFDLIAAKPRKGDRTQRESDKYLFLETLISAQKRLFLSYTGRSETDNRELVPSIIVTELIRHLEMRFGVAAPVTEHPLHNFSRRYFENNPKLYTYSSQRFNAASVFGTQAQEKKFCPSPLEAEIPAEVTIADLERFFSNPPAYFLGRTLGIDLSIQQTAYPETERMVLDNLQEFQLRTETTASVLADGSPDDILAYAAATAQLPAGGLGEGYKARIVDSAVQMANEITKHGQPRSADIDLTVNGLRIHGRIEGITDNGLIYPKTGGLKPKDLMRAMIRHVLLLKSGDSIRTLLVNDKGDMAELSGEGFKETLETLVRLFIDGHRAPLCFHPTEGFAAAKKTLKDSRKYSGIGGDLFYSASNLPQYSLCFGTEDITERLMQTGIEIFKGLENTDDGQ